MKNKKQASGKKSFSLSAMVTLVIVFALLTTSIVFVIMMNATRIIPMLKSSTVGSFSRSVKFEGDDLQSKMNNIARAGMELSQRIEKLLSTEALDEMENFILNAELLSGVQSHMLDTLKLNLADGLLVVLDPQIVYSDEFGIHQKGMDALYIKDQNVSSVFHDHSDLMLVVGAKEIARDLNIPLDRYWEPVLQLDAESQLHEVVDEITKFGMENVNLPITELGSWFGPFQTIGGESVMMFGLPLIDPRTDSIIGMIGMELSVSHIKQFLSASILRYQEASFLALVPYDDSSFNVQTLTSSGKLLSYMQMYSATVPDEIVALPEYGEDAYQVNYSPVGQMLVIRYPLKLYSNSQGVPYCLEGGVLVDVIFAPIDKVQRLILATFIVSLVAGFSCVVIIFIGFSHTMSKLGKQVKRFDPDDRESQFATSGIKEIDRFVSALNELKLNFEQVSDRLTDAINMTGMPIGFVEVDTKRQRVFASDLIFRWFHLDSYSHEKQRKSGNSAFISISVWNPLFEQLMSQSSEDDPSVHPLDFVDTLRIRWLRVQIAQHQEKSLCIFVDVTKEMMDRKDFEYQRDFDSLTGLLNRRAFLSHVDRMLTESPDRHGAIVFIDLDNLKSINDTYGHENGDIYIRNVASAFRSAVGPYQLVSRFSGDEFAIFLYGFASEEAVRNAIVDFHASVTAGSTHDNALVRVRCSMGCALYPEDSTNIEQLIKFADFTMYEVKKTNKGAMQLFDHGLYDKNAFLVESSGALNELIERNEVRYAFQPIVCAEDGSVFAYEALMRPTHPVFKTPVSVLDMAKFQAKMYQIERMTLMNMFGWVEEHRDILDGRKMFINSIADQMLVGIDMDELEERYGHLFADCVIEFTESERYSREMVKAKTDFIRKLEGKVAIDDYGAGYSNNLLMLIANPDYIKIDMQLIAGIDKDINKQVMVRNIVGYVKSQGWKVIAEGVERWEEAEMVVRLGVDYLQGYYFHKPDFELCECPQDIRQRLVDLSSTLTIHQN